MTSSASFKPLSTSPWIRVNLFAMFVPGMGLNAGACLYSPIFSCKRGASGFIASTGSKTVGRDSYSMFTSSDALSAPSSVSATTIATGCPDHLTFSTARRSLSPAYIPTLKGMSCPVSTATTPGTAFEAVVSILVIRACGIVLVTSFAWSEPGIEQSYV